MKKSLRLTPLATAVAAVLCLGPGSASALDINLYGVGHLSVDSNDDGKTSQLYVASNSSRLGFKGGHDLDNGMRIVFQYEAGVDLTGRGTNDGNGPGVGNGLFTTARDSFAGLSTSAGTVLAGRLGVLNQWLYDYNLFADQVGDLGNLWGGTGLPGRANGVIAYATPKIADSLDGLVAYVPESGNKNAASVLVKVNFAKGGLKLGGAYLSLGKGNFTSPPAPAPGVTNPTSHTTAAITGSYGFGAFSVGGGYQTESDIGGNSGVNRKSYTVGASYNFGASTIKAQYTNSNSNQANQDANMIAVGYDYAFDKATTLYVAYAKTTNQSAATFKANNYGHGQAIRPGELSANPPLAATSSGTPGLDPSSISVGLVYKFDLALMK